MNGLEELISCLFLCLSKYPRYLNLGNPLCLIAFRLPGRATTIKGTPTDREDLMSRSELCEVEL